MNCPYCQSSSIVKNGKTTLQDRTDSQNYLCNKVKGSQGNRRVEWVKPEHPFTAVSLPSQVHANHNEAHNSALRRRCSAYRRRQNLYAKTVEGLQRTLTVQRLVHNWVRPHWGLAKGTTPAMAMGLYDRPVKMQKLLNWRRLPSITS